MRKTCAIAPSWSELRPVKGAPAAGTKRKGFPVYEDLERTLARVAPPGEPDPIARHVCAALSAWAYSDPATVAMILSRLGLERCRVRCVELANDAMIIRAVAYLVQSLDGRVALLAYRGTEPFELSSWAVDADVNNPAILTPGNVRADPPTGADAGREPRRGEAPALVHAGFYRNQRATWFEVVAALTRALDGKSILEDAEEAALGAPAGPSRPLEALFVTGHSLGAAMATIAAYKLAADPDYARPPAALAQVVRQVYLFAPPMVGNREFKALWNRATLGGAGTLDARVFAHTFARDVVPHVPPQGTTTYVHVGKHFASKELQKDRGPGSSAWVPADAPTPCTVYDMARALEPLVFGQVTWRELLGSKLLGKLVGDVEGLLNRLVHPPLSFADHIPTNYLLCSQPPSVNSELGDDF